MTTDLLSPTICRQQHPNPPCYLLRRLFQSAISRYIKYRAQWFRVVSISQALENTLVLVGGRRKNFSQLLLV